MCWLLLNYEMNSFGILVLGGNVIELLESVLFIICFIVKDID